MASSHPLRFYILGDLRIWRLETLIARPPRRTYSLLASLLLRPRPQSRAQLAQRLFSHLSETEGRRRLSDLLWLLRRALPDLPLDVTADSISLTVAARWLDVEAFQRLIAGPTPAEWLEALNLYRNELLPGLHDEWVQSERAALHIQFIHFLQRVTALDVDDPQLLLPFAQRLMREEPYDEKALRLVMHLYTRLGRRAHALAAYDEYAARATLEFSWEPEPETRRLAQELRQPTASTASPSALVLAADPDALRLARAAFDRGDLKSLRRFLAQTSDAYPGVRLLRCDLALLQEDYPLAAQLLADEPAGDAELDLRRAELALAAGDQPAAYQHVARALLMALQRSSPMLEASALLLLARVHQAHGHAMSAANVIDRALIVAEQHRSPLQVVEAYAQRGALLARYSRYDEAVNALYEAETLARQYGFQRHLAQVLNQLGFIHARSGALVQARATLRRALAIWRDIALEAAEAYTLCHLSLVHIQLGLHTESQQLARQAQTIFRQHRHTLGLAMVEYALALSLAAQDTAAVPAAVTRLERAAMPGFRAVKRLDWEGAGLTLLAQLLWLNEQYQASLAVIRQAQARFDQLGELSVRPLVFAIQALALLASGEKRAAAAAVSQALLILAQGAAAPDDAPLIYLAHGLTAADQGEEGEAAAAFKRAYEALQRQADHLADEAARRAMLERDPMTRRLLHEVYQRGLAQLPAGMLARLLPAVNGGQIMVHWSVDLGPADLIVRRSLGEVALRRVRLQRLLREARAQGAAPTVAQLAQALAVSERTIQRDLAALRSAPPAEG